MALNNLPYEPAADVLPCVARAGSVARRAGGLGPTCPIGNFIPTLVREKARGAQ